MSEGFQVSIRLHDGVVKDLITIPCNATAEDMADAISNICQKAYELGCLHEGEVLIHAMQELRISRQKTYR